MAIIGSYFFIFSVKLKTFLYENIYYYIYNNILNTFNKFNESLNEPIREKIITPAVINPSIVSIDVPNPKILDGRTVNTQSNMYSIIEVISSLLIVSISLSIALYLAFKDKGVLNEYILKYLNIPIYNDITFPKVLDVSLLENNLTLIKEDFQRIEKLITQLNILNYNTIDIKERNIKITEFYKNCLELYAGDIETINKSILNIDTLYKNIDLNEETKKQLEEIDHRNKSIKRLIAKQFISLNNSVNILQPIVANGSIIN